MNTRKQIISSAHSLADKVIEDLKNGRFPIYETFETSWLVFFYELWEEWLRRFPHSGTETCRSTEIAAVLKEKYGYGKGTLWRDNAKYWFRPGGVTFNLFRKKNGFRCRPLTGRCHYFKHTITEYVAYPMGCSAASLAEIFVMFGREDKNIYREYARIMQEYHFQKSKQKLICKITTTTDAARQK